MIDHFKLNDFQKDTLINITPDKESEAYLACEFTMSQKRVFYRKSKVTPKKMGQFVTFWKRNTEGITQPIPEKYDFDFLIINLKTSTNNGYFIFPKCLLITKGILSSEQHKGKRGFRIYPPWNKPKSKQAQSTQKWQIPYFCRYPEI